MTTDVPQARERRPGVYWPEDIKAAVDQAYEQGRAAERQRIRERVMAWRRGEYTSLDDALEVSDDN